MLYAPYLLVYSVINRGLIIKNLHKILFSVFLILWISNSCAQHTETGYASYYNDKLEGKQTANGEVYRMDELTAAHRTLPFNTKIKVTNLSNNKTVIVRVNDRGPYAKGRILDLSKKAAVKLDFIDRGVIKIKLEVIAPK